VDHVLHIRNVQTARGHIGAHQNRTLVVLIDQIGGLGLAKLERLVFDFLDSGLEPIERLQSLLLLHLRV